MVGFAVDENPVPDRTLGYELPDSDAKLYSIGFRYVVNDRLEIGAAYLRSVKEKRTITASAGNTQGIDGEFSDGGAQVINVGGSYRF
jgi:long-chain fatty acid transport protein